MKASLQKIFLMEKDELFGMIKLFTKVNFTKDNDKVKAFSLYNKVKDMKDSSKTTKSTDKVFSLKQMVKNMRVNLKTTKCMDKAFIILQTEENMKANTSTTKGKDKVFARL